MILKNPQFTIKPEHAITMTRIAGSVGPGGVVSSENIVVSFTGEFDVSQYLIDDIKEQIQDYRATVELMLQTLKDKKEAAQAVIDANKP